MLWLQKKPIFKDFSLHIGPGESVLVTGINGVGKTTLLRLMSGVLFPRAGRVIYSESLGKEPRAKIGFISDKINLYENLTMEQAIRFHSSV
jgi:ABC-2 type transport system ATP-binding protein